MKIAVTFKRAVQISEHDYRIKSVTRIFDDSKKICDIMTWAKIHASNAGFWELDFSEIEE